MPRPPLSKSKSDSSPGKGTTKLTKDKLCERVKRARDVQKQHLRPLVFKIVRQPHEEIIYNRILKPVPVLLMRGFPTDDTIYVVDAVLIDEKGTVVPDGILGSQRMTIENDQFCSFARLKVGKTSQQVGKDQDSTLRIQFVLKSAKRGGGYEPTFWDEGEGAVTAETTPMKVYSHTTYLNKKDSD